MIEEWITQSVSLKYMLSDKIIFKINVLMKVLPFKIISKNHSLDLMITPSISLEEGEGGYLMRSVQLSTIQPRYRADHEYIYYIPDQFNRYYIDLNQTFEKYSAKFSSKTRSSIRRKIKKLSNKCDGKLHWKKYRDIDGLKEFYGFAREVSSTSYQEILLGSGLPDTKEFKKEMFELAQEDLARGYLLFDDCRPVAYMYCPIKDGVLLYQYLGFNPEYSKWSVGTILHWYSFEDIFNEKKFHYFDFTEGQSEHKRLYSTGSVLCGNVYVFQKGIKAWMMVKSHCLMNELSSFIGLFLDHLGVKSKIKKIIRRKKS